MISKPLLDWYSSNKRTLPWRNTKDPYKIWISEIMLQQTQVATAIPYYNRWIKRFPNALVLSQTPYNEVLKLWEGLGYYKRAKNLHKTSKILVKEFDEKIPNSFIKLKELPGIGDYTANVLLALVYNEPRIGIDGNVKRLLQRIFNTNIDKAPYSFKTKRNGDLAEALMEFGSLICKPKDPLCSQCNINDICLYYMSDAKINFNEKTKIKSKSYDIFCYLKKNKKQIALTKNNDLGFLKDLNLPQVKKTSKKNKSWKFLCNYKNFISNKKLNINLYYKFASKIPSKYNWYSLNKNSEFIPTFTKKIFKQVSNLY